MSLKAIHDSIQPLDQSKDLLATQPLEPLPKNVNSPRKSLIVLNGPSLAPSSAYSPCGLEKPSASFEATESSCAAGTWASWEGKRGG